MPDTESKHLSSQLEVISNTVVDGIITIDARGIVLSFNLSAQRMFGYAPDEVIGENVRMLMMDPHAARHDQYLAHYLETGVQGVIGVGRELKGRRKDGSLFPIELTVSEMSVNDARCFVGVIRDVSERERINEAIRVATERLSIATTAAKIGIWDWQIPANHLVWDEQMYRLYGISADRFAGAYEAWQAGLHPADVDQASEDVQQALRGERDFNSEFRVIWPDGSIHFIKAYAKVTRDENGAPVRMVGTNWDITLIKEVEAALAHNNKELQLAARIDRIGARIMLALNAQGEQPQAGAEILRVLAEEAGYRPLAFYSYEADSELLCLRAGLGLAPGQDQQTYELGQALVGEAAQQRVPIFVEGGAGAPFRLETGFGVVQVQTLFALPLLHGDNLLGVVAGASHTSLLERERSWLEQTAGQVAIGLHSLHQLGELRLLSAELDERARTIEAKNAELAQANRMKSEFMTTMSHELRTPLNAVIGFTNILLKNKGDNLRAPDLNFLRRVLANGLHLLALINDILNLSKYEAGRMELDLELVRLDELAREVLVDIHAQPERPELVIVGNVPARLRPINADRRRLKQVLINLVGNAMKFTEAGAIELRVRASDDRALRIDVIDSGEGIPRDKLDGVMEAFSQVDNSTSRRFEGTGLGLTISRAFCMAMGFRLEIDSVLGQGTLLSIMLCEDAPAVVYEPPARSGTLELDVFDEALSSWSPSSRSLTPPGSKPGPTVLLVDDDPDARAVIEQYLDELGCSVLTVDSGRRGLEVARATRPTLVVLDLLMPGMNGLAVLKAFRDDPDLRRIPVVVCSIVGGEHRYQLTHAVEVLCKPVEREHLAVVIRRVLPGKDSRVSGHPSVLIIDDEPDARTVVADIAEELELQVRMAENGQLGLEAVEAEVPDLIILDLMMPVLDGFGVLAALRSMPKLRATPVIVCTAAELDQHQREQLEVDTPHLITKGEGTAKQLRELLRELLRSELPSERGAT